MGFTKPSTPAGRALALARLYEQLEAADARAGDLEATFAWTPLRLVKVRAALDRAGRELLRLTTARGVLRP